MDTSSVVLATIEPSPPALSMPPEAFRAFHEATSKTLLGYLTRLTGNSALAEDITQESYLRLLRSNIPLEAEYIYRRNYLFKIATNLARDQFRGSKWEELPEVAAVGNLERATVAASDVRKALAGLTTQERALLWLAYVEQMSHREIGHVLELKEESVRTMIFRAKKRFTESYS